MVREIATRTRSAIDHGYAFLLAQHLLVTRKGFLSPLARQVQALIDLPGRLPLHQGPDEDRVPLTFTNGREDYMDTMELWGDCGNFAMSGRIWRVLLAIAPIYGWEPAGTQAPDPEYVRDIEPSDLASWDGRYYPGCLQRITEDDSHRLAAALETALSEIPDLQMNPPICDGAPKPSQGSEFTVRGATPTTNTLVDDTEPTVRDLIKHLREPGGVWIG